MTQEVYATDGRLGVDVTSTASTWASNSASYQPDYVPGAKVVTSDTGEHVYVKASEAITAGDVLLITPQTGSAQQMSTARATQNTSTVPVMVGVANATLVSGQYGWACLRGIPNAGINTAASCNKGTPLYTTSTAGQVSTTSSSSVLISGMETSVTTTGAAVVAGFCSNPVLVTGTVNNV